jgi:hypothetical protein
VRHPRQVGPDGGARDVLAEPDGERAGRRREVVEDVAEGDEVRALVGQLDPDGLLAGDRGEDADLRRGERVGEVVLERGDLRDLGARSELELASTPKLASVWTSDSAMRALVSAEAPLVAFERRSTSRSGRTYSPAATDSEMSNSVV